MRLFSAFKPIFCFLLLGLTTLSACNKQEVNSSEEPTINKDQPNILLILTDDQGYADLGSSGSTDLQTPYIDSLVSAGMRFDNFYANCPVCSPTRAALLTGRYQEFVGVPGVIRTDPKDSWGYLREDAVLISEVLKDADYHTGLVGKWHLGLESPNRPNDRGFMHFKGWLGDMMDDYVEKRRHGINYMRLNEQEIDPPGHATDVFSQWAVDYIQERKEGENPFFLYLAYNAPHYPVQPPDVWLKKVKAREPNISEKRAKIVAFIEHMDHGIGQVIEALKTSGQYENTLIVFSSDNGGLLQDAANNGPHRDGKGSVYEGGLKVPTAIVWPGKIKAGSRVENRLLSMDIFPTLLAAADIQAEQEIEGINFLPLLRGETMETDDRPVFFSRREGNMRYGGKTIEAVRLGDWKLLQNSPYGPRELYNLKNDPLEQHDLFKVEGEKVKELNALLMDHLQKAGQVPWQK
jgi:arylsulfatase A-like enzyme